MSRVFAAGLGNQNMVIEGVSIQTETSRARNPVTSEVLVLALRPKASQASPVLALPPALPGARLTAAMERAGGTPWTWAR
jgi:hypothetical protein